MADSATDLPSTPSTHPLLRRALWVLFLLLVAIMVVAQFYVLMAGSTGARGEVGPTPLAESGIRFVQASLNNFASDADFPAVALAVAMLLGGLHALSPGHNKVLTGAYLVSSQGRPAHAILIGLATAFSHTATVIVIGLLALSTRGQMLASLYLRWLGVPSGLVVVGLGVFLLTRHLGGELAHGHDHVHSSNGDHDLHTPHSHSYVLPTRFTLGGLVALGLIHGIIPTTDALAVLLVALSVKQAALGIGLILSYSLGIALVMSLVGILFLRSQRWLNARFERLTRWMPPLAALLVILFGFSILTRSLATLL